MQLVLQLSLALLVSAQTSNSGDATISGGSIAATLTALPTNSRATYGLSDSTITFATITSSSTYTGASNVTSHNATSASGSSMSSSSQTYLVGTGTRATSTPSIAVACNGYNEFCDRLYSNVTYVVAHNSPFHIASNAASNQVYDVTQQLDDGIRAIQSETHYVNETVYLCHTSCDELNAGPLEDYLVKVKAWLDQSSNRFEVITILLGNEDFIDPGNYTAPFTNSGLLPYLYTPSTQPMGLDGWPTLGDMILTNKRVVTMLAYDADQTAIPWLLDMFSYQWQTPFSPTNDSFPCTVQRPPGQARNTSENRLYLANHNLNVAIDLAALGDDSEVLVPDTVALDNTNANTTVTGAAGTTIEQCTNEWGRPPNYLLVDFYNYGNFNGSALAAAAKANNVTYNVNSCCGKDVTSIGSISRSHRLLPPALLLLYLLY